MPRYTFESPDGRRVTVEGDSEPNDTDLEEIFRSLPARQDVVNVSDFPMGPPGGGANAVTPLDNESATLDTPQTSQRQPEPNMNLVGYKPSMEEEVGGIVARSKFARAGEAFGMAGKGLGDVLEGGANLLSRKGYGGATEGVLRGAGVAARAMLPQNQEEGMRDLAIGAFTSGLPAPSGILAKRAFIAEKLGPQLTGSGQSLGQEYAASKLPAALEAAHPFVKSFGTAPAQQVAEGVKATAGKELGSDITRIEAKAIAGHSKELTDTSKGALRDRIYGKFNKEPVHDPELGQAASAIREDINAVIPSIRNPKVVSVLKDLEKTGAVQDVTETAASRVYERVTDPLTGAVKKVARKGEPVTKVVGQEPVPGAGISDYSIQEARAYANSQIKAAKSPKLQASWMKIKSTLDEAGERRGVPFADINAMAKATFYDSQKNTVGARALDSANLNIEAILKKGDVTKEALAAMDEGGRFALQGQHIKLGFEAMDKSPKNAQTILRSYLDRDDGAITKALHGEGGRGLELMKDYANAVSYAAKEAAAGAAKGDSLSRRAADIAVGGKLGKARQAISLVKKGWEYINGNKQSEELASKALREYSDESLKKLSINIQSRTLAEQGSLKMAANADIGAAQSGRQSDALRQTEETISRSGYGGRSMESLQGTTANLEDLMRQRGMK